MRPNNDWEGFLLSETERLREVFVTQPQFEQVIEQLLANPDCPLSGLQFEVDCPRPYQSFLIGVAGPSTGDGTRSFSPHDNRSTECRAHFWRETGKTAPAKLDLELEGLFEAYWKPQLRTTSAGMPDLKRDNDARVQAQRTVDASIRDRRPCSVLYCDLDNFGRVNKEISHDEGNRIIKEFSAILEDVVRNEATVLHDGGDEFVVLVPGRGGNRAIGLAFCIKKAIDGHDFNSKGIELGVSVGIATSETTEVPTFDDLLSRSDRALKDHAKQPRKGVARFCPEDAVADFPATVDQRLDLALCIIKSNMQSYCPFANGWLNCLSQVVASCVNETGISFTDIQRSVDELIQWAGLETLPIGDCRSAIGREKGFDAHPAVAEADFALAIAHGIFRAMLAPGKSGQTLAMKLAYGPGGAVALLHSDGKVIWAAGDSVSNCTESYDLGSGWSYDSESSQTEPTSRALLIKIGNDEPEFSKSILSGRPIYVDDRPSSSGGLPDFWEATIARLIAEVNRNRNIGAIYLLGEHKNGARTKEKLETVERWGDAIDQLSFKTGMRNQDIRSAASFLLGRVHFPSSEVDLISHLAGVLRPPHTIQPLLESASADSDRFLTLRLDMDGMSLSQEDGCRVKTIAEAYPIVIDIVRKNEGSQTIMDQAGQELRELVDFKVHLTNPHENQVPTFYKEERDSFDKYFTKEFLSVSGLFGSEFIGSGQLEAVIDHLVRIIKDSARQFATRRAILVVPHRIEPAKDISPLGLVSVRLVPRFLPGRVRISYSYTWRTVEALIGFPYSLYGSVRYSEYLTEQIANRLKPQTQNEKRIEMGEVSYIAHSMHIFMDHFGQNIARAIVNNANI